MTRTIAIRTLLFAAGFASAFLPARAAGRASRPTDSLAYPPLHAIQQPAAVRETLPNGLRLLLVEDRALPKIQVLALIRGGQFAEPKDRPGLADLFGEVLRTGGVQSLSGDDVDTLLDRLGAAIESGVDVDSVSVSGRALTEAQDQVLPLFAEFLRRPAFAPEKIELAKTHMRSAISRRNDNVEGIASREFDKLIYGADSPYARQAEYDDVDRLSRDDLLAYHARVFRPDETIIAAWGDFAAPEMKAKLVRLLGDWAIQGPKPAYEPPPMLKPAHSINFIQKGDVEQTFIRMGHEGLRLDNPDYPAVRVLSEVLGEGFASRLFVKVRTEKGLAYRAGGRLGAEFDRPGLFAFVTSTKPTTTAEALTTVLEEIKKIREAPVSDDELKRAKEGYLNSYAFEYDTTGKVVRRLVSYEFYGYPENFNIRLRDAVEKVTKDDVLQAAKKYLHPELLTILAIGKAEQFDKPLSTFGQVRNIDITIPEPKGAEETPPATAESLAKGQQLLLAAARGVGEKALAALHDLTIEATMTQETPGGAMEMAMKEVLAPPERHYVELTTPMGGIVMVVGGPDAWMKMGPNSRPMPEAQAGSLRRGLLSGYGCLGLLKQALAGQVDAQALGPVSFEGQKAQLVLVRRADKPLRVLLSEDGGRVLGVMVHEQTPEGAVETTTIFSEPKSFDGLTLPQATTTKVKDKVRGGVRLTNVKVNAGVDPALFEKPKEGEAK